MKGVLLRSTDARLVDISHDFPRGDVRTTAFWLREILPYFPPAVHLVVVDPGVGTDRDALVGRAGHHLFVGPDNGVLLPVARRIAPDPAFFSIDYGSPDSSTFHGRDVFAPMAATIHEHGPGRIKSIESLVPVTDVVDLVFPEPEAGDDTVSGEILVIDTFGNAITNIPGDAVTPHFGNRIDVCGEPVDVAANYAAVESGTPLVTVGSHGNVELAVNQGRGDRVFDVSIGSAVRLEW